MSETAQSIVTANTLDIRHALGSALEGNLEPLLDLPEGTAFNVLGQDDQQVSGPIFIDSLRLTLGSCASSLTGYDRQQPPRRATIRPNTLDSVVVANHADTVQ